MRMPVRRCLQFLPSQIAAAAVLLAQHVLSAHVWSPTLQHYSGYWPSELQVHTSFHLHTICWQIRFRHHRQVKVSLQI